ncbi:synaptonemal complex protein ZEP1-like [Cajanus cajan]|uniref:synaptonemal complex protein ZEP1-like n=1 Tax=Cajanus cajan TaxID=3821 RepID=UPI00098D86A6|nr:synaptonemal complex protein ZEP1-like [Cajanus cajan]
MGRSKWRELKGKFNTKEIEIFDVDRPSRKGKKQKTNASVEAGKRESDKRVVRSICQGDLGQEKKKLAETIKAFEISIRSNKSYSAKVEELLSKVKVMEREKEENEKECTKLREKIEEKEKTMLDLQEEIQRLTEQNKACQEVIAADVERVTELDSKNKSLNEELQTTELHVISEHRKGFAKAFRQTRVIAPEVNLQELNVNKDVFDGKLVNKDDLPEDVSSED